MAKKEALEATAELIKALDEIEQLYGETKENKIEYDFYKDIEPYVTNIHEKIKRWESLVTKEVAAQNIRYFGMKQIEQVCSNTGELAIQAFHHTTSHKRFKDHYQSTKFLLTSISKKLD